MTENVEGAEPFPAFVGLLGAYVDRVVRTLPRQPGHPFHGTVPCRSAGRRVTIGFDVVPLQ